VSDRGRRCQSLAIVGDTGSPFFLLETIGLAGTLSIRIDQIFDETIPPIAFPSFAL
jgi:hypothetical protein